MKNLLIALSLLASALLVSASPASADRSPYSCRNYFGGESDIPVEARSILARVKGGAAQLCRLPPNPAGDDLFWSLLPAIRETPAVCQFAMQRLFKDGTSWSETPPPGQEYLAAKRVAMMVTESPCPRQDDPRYVTADEVSPETFLIATRFWQRLSSKGENGKSLVEVDWLLRWTSEFNSFESALLGERPPMTLVRVSIYRGRGAKAGLYQLDLEGSPNSWFLEAEVQGDVMRLVGIGRRFL